MPIYQYKWILVFLPSSLLESLDELRLICQTAAVYCVFGSVLIRTHIGSPVWTSPTTSAIFPVHALEEQSLGSLKHSNEVCLLSLKDKISMFTIWCNIRFLKRIYRIWYYNWSVLTLYLPHQLWFPPCCSNLDIILHHQASLLGQCEQKFDLISLEEGNMHAHLARKQDKALKIHLKYHHL